MSLPVAIMLTFVSLFNFLLHTIGCYLLSSAYRNGRKCVHMIWLIHLSVIVAIKNVSKFAWYILFFLRLQKSMKSSVVNIMRYLGIIDTFAIGILYYLIMIYLTVDRLFCILLNFKYPVFWNITRTKHLLCGTWTLIFLLLLSVSIGQWITGFLDGNHLPLFYLYICLDVLFLIVAVLTYCVMFYKYATSVRRNSQYSVHCFNQTSSLNLFKTFRQSKFSISVILIFSFLVFDTIPDMIMLISVINKKGLLVPVYYFLRVCIIVSDTSIACTYIFVQKTIRELLWQKLQCLCKGNNTQEHRNITITWRKHGRVAITM